MGLWFQRAKYVFVIFRVAVAFKAGLHRVLANVANDMTVFIKVLEGPSTCRRRARVADHDVDRFPRALEQLGSRLFENEPIGDQHGTFGKMSGAKALLRLFIRIDVVDQSRRLRRWCAVF